jgi:3-hydroxyacyl-[acyl-carrier-protein] dehydratase
VSGPADPVVERNGEEDGERHGSRRRIAVRREIAADDPLFLGHFPGRPIFPGIAQLDLVARAIAATTSRETALSHVHNLKLRRQVLPGDTLGLVVHLDEADGTARFEIRCGAERVSQGTAAAIGVEPGVGPTAAFATRRSAASPYPDPAALLPHAPPARLLVEVLDLTPAGVTCRAEIPATHPLVNGGRAPAFLGLEAAAQAAALLEAQQRTGSDGEPAGPRIGYLVGIRDARFPAPHLPATTAFRVHVQAAGSAPPLAVYTVRIDIGEEMVGVGTISTYLPAGEP